MLEEADYDMTAQAMGQNEDQDAQNLFIRFYDKMVQDPVKSDAEGRPVFVERCYVEIRARGQMRPEIDEPACDIRKRKYPRHYQAYLDRVNSEEQVTGTLLTEWGGVTRTLAEELKFAKCFTVEQLAEMPDTMCQSWAGLMGARENAKKWLSATSEARGKQELTDAMAKKDAQIASLVERLEALEAASEEAPAPRRRGRPSKAEKAAQEAAEAAEE